MFLDKKIIPQSSQQRRAFTVHTGVLRLVLVSCGRCGRRTYVGGVGCREVDAYTHIHHMVPMYEGVVLFAWSADRKNVRRYRGM